MSNEEIHPTAVIINQEEVGGRSLEISFVEDYRQGEKTALISTLFIDMNGCDDEWDTLVEFLRNLIDEGLREPRGGSGMLNRKQS